MVTNELKTAMTDRYVSYKGGVPSYEHAVLWPLIDVLTPGATVLDVASGIGAAANCLETCRFKVVRTDISMRALDRSHGMRVCSFAQMLPFRDSCFDAIHMKDALVHIPEKNVLFQEFRRVLRPGGRLVIASGTLSEEVTPYLAYRECGEDKTIKFNSWEEYERLIYNLLLRHVSYIGSAYYSTTSQDTITIAQMNGLDLVEQTSWCPAQGEADWYVGRAERFVLFFQKR